MFTPDSMYAQFVLLPFDVYQDRGLLFKSSGLQSWGDSIAYYNVGRDEGEESNAWAAGAYYKVTSAFDVFVELADGDNPSMRKESLADRSYWLTGGRYHF